MLVEMTVQNWVGGGGVEIDLTNRSAAWSSCRIFLRAACCLLRAAFAFWCLRARSVALSALEDFFLVGIPSYSFRKSKFSVTAESTTLSRIGQNTNCRLARAATGFLSGVP